jgi:hypothetical protein
MQVSHLIITKTFYTLNVLQYDVDKSIGLYAINVLHYVIMLQFLQKCDLLMQGLVLLLTDRLHRDLFYGYQCSLLNIYISGYILQVQTLVDSPN